jgi:hypothetical protein
LHCKLEVHAAIVNAAYDSYLELMGRECEEPLSIDVGVPFITCDGVTILAMYDGDEVVVTTTVSLKRRVK